MTNSDRDIGCAEELCEHSHVKGTCARCVADFMDRRTMQIEEQDAIVARAYTMVRNRTLDASPPYREAPADTIIEEVTRLLESIIVK